nr:MAG TPA: hypothetical protein [Bacteriophage sp.]
MCSNLIHTFLPYIILPFIVFFEFATKSICPVLECLTLLHFGSLIASIY